MKKATKKKVRVAIKDARQSLAKRPPIIPISVEDVVKLLPPQDRAALEVGRGIKSLLDRAAAPLKLTAPQAAETFTGLTEVLEMVGSAEKSLKASMKARIQEQGEKQPQGGFLLHTDGWTWPLTVHTAKGTLDDKKVEAMLRAKGIAPEEGMDVDIKYKANRQKLEDLALSLRARFTAIVPGTETEKALSISPEDIQACEKEASYALQMPRRASTSEGVLERVVENQEGGEE